MFIRKSINQWNKVNYVLVESIWTAKGPRQKTVCFLGDLKPRPRAEWLKLAHKVEIALTDQMELFQGRPDAEVEEIVKKVRKREALKNSKEPVNSLQEDDLVEVH